MNREHYSLCRRCVLVLVWQCVAEGTHLVVYQRVLTHCAPSVLLMSSDDKGSVVYIILQQPHKGLTFVLAKLKCTPAQNKALIIRVAALRANADLRLGLYLLGRLFWYRSVL